ncbi:EamA family transporter RarD [Tepidicaulis sp. LMO-SS28]|uniref:EamA family transporter RarD n=1 Tax=Tepidicaulis sp. LMO-SS28 TaxID=3447455 RepID=UPI003EE29E48
MTNTTKEAAPQPVIPAPSREAMLGTISAGMGYTLWGVSVIYYKQLIEISPFEVLAHRSVWTVLLLIPAVWALHRFGLFKAALKNKRLLGTLALTALIIGSNWFVFIYSINASRVVETSLGYYINPLVSVLLGVFFLSEKLSKAQIVAVVLAAAGVANMTWALGELPWISLFLAFSFAGYGYLRKITPVGAVEGLLVEMLVLLPVSLGYLLWLEGTAGTSFVGGDSWTVFLLMMTGPMTAVPLLLFTYGAQRIRLATLGLMQYFAPSLQFLFAVWLYGEALTDTHIVTFALIWTGLAIFSADTWRRERALRRLARLSQVG